MNTEANALAAVDALILCGGLGTRLRPVIGDRPKGLAEVSGRPVLDILVDDLLIQGCRRIIFCVGHMKEQIIRHFGGRDDAEFLFAEEEVPLGTGGAVTNALPLVQSDPLLVLNGDSLCRVNLGQFLEYHRNRRALASLVLAEPGERHDGGIVRADSEMRITRFLEKPDEVILPGSFINAGIYLFQRQSLGAGAQVPPYSLEIDLFPALAATGHLFGFRIGGEVVDIGTPERYQKANHDPMFLTFGSGD